MLFRSVRLKAMIDRAGWLGTHEDNEAFAASLVESLAELVSIAQQATKIEWTASPVTMESMATYCRDTKIATDKAKADLTRLVFLRKKQQKIKDAINRDRRASDMAQQASRFEIGRASCRERV